MRTVGTLRGTGCGESCWNETIAPLTEHVPVVTGEFGDFGCVDTYINEYMPWADAHGVSYLAWTWSPDAPGIAGRAVFRFTAGLAWRHEPLGMGVCGRL